MIYKFVVDMQIKMDWGEESMYKCRVIPVDAKYMQALRGMFEYVISKTLRGANFAQMTGVLHLATNDDIQLPAQSFENLRIYSDDLSRTAVILTAVMGSYDHNNNSSRPLHEVHIACKPTKLILEDTGERIHISNIFAVASQGEVTGLRITPHNFDFIVHWDNGVTLECSVIDDCKEWDFHEHFR